MENREVKGDIETNKLKTLACRRKFKIFDKIHKSLNSKIPHLLYVAFASTQSTRADIRYSQTLKPLVHVLSV